MLYVAILEKSEMASKSIIIEFLYFILCFCSTYVSLNPMYPSC